MAGSIVTAAELVDYLGADPGEETLELVERLRAAAIEDICRATGTDWSRRQRVEAFNEALRTQVWLSYYAVRDGVKNTQFLQQYLNGLVCSLQLCQGEEDDDV